MVVQGADEQAALRAAEAAAARLDALVDEGVLAGYDSVTRLLPSAAAQQARLASLPEAATLRARLAEATRRRPAAGRAAGTLRRRRARRRARKPPMRRADLQGSALAGVVDALLFERPGGGWPSLVPLHAGARFDAARLRAALAGAAARCR